MNKKKILIITILSLVIILLLIFTDRIISNNLTLEFNDDIGVYIVNNEDNIEIIAKNYQKDISKLIHNKLNNKIYTKEKPLMILNPYGTNITGLYINFFTLEKVKIEYTISIEGEGIPEYTNTLSGGLTRKHEGQIIGLIQGYENTITIKLIDKNNKIKSTYEFKINMPDYNTNSIKKLDSEYDDANEISDGLYVVCSSRNKQTYVTLPLSFYDKYGVLRAEFTNDSGTDTFKIEIIDDNLLYAIEPQIYIMVNKLGKIVKTYKISHNNNHENIYNKYNKSILYINSTDKIRKLNLKDNTDTLLIDLGELLKEYKEKTIKYHKENFNYYENLDWAHLNSIEIVNKNDIIISSRETSSIIYIMNAYTKPEIKYIIAPETIYENTEYTKYLLKKIGDFPVHAGQHAAIIKKDKKLKEHQYYIIFYNNNYAPSEETIFNIGWEKIIEGVGKDGKPAKNSAYYKYLIDEKEKTYTLIESIKVPYSYNVSSVQILDNGYLINSGDISTIQEYNEEKKLILTLKSLEEFNIYRAYKYDMKNFWFS